MSKTVHVELKERGYDIRIGRDLPIGETLGELKDARALIVTDSNVDPQHGSRVEAALRARGMAAVRAVVKAGEESKNLETVRQLYTQALTAGLDRSSLIVALGGGMVGDVAGFTAATFMRGIRLVQIPTTLLAMVDSGVGGKTGVNLPEGKNLVGAFHQPAEVVADLSFLDTLPKREYVSGLAEVVKYGVIWDADLFRKLEAQADKLLDRDPAVLEAVVARCCAVKAEIVAMDERETGVRAILNFGHTLAHAVEASAGYGAWLHGEAVAAGMVFACDLSVARKSLGEHERERIAGLLTRLGLPVRVGGIAWADLKAVMQTDKKARRGSPRFVLVERIGGAVWGCDVPEEAQSAAFSRLSA